MALVTLPVAFMTIPVEKVRESGGNEKRTMDLGGCLAIIPGLALFTFAITDSALAPDGWKPPYILSTFVAGIILLGLVTLVEGWYAKDPLLPFDLFHVPSMPASVIALLFSTVS